MPDDIPSTEIPAATGDAPATSSPGIVHSDVPCRDCGYNLRTLAHDHRCPECGLSVQWSAQGYQLKFARLSWLRQLRWGCDLIIVAFIFAAIAFPVLVGLLDPYIYNTNDMLPLIGVSVLAIAVTCGIAGAWLMTMVEPDQRGRRRPRYSLIVRVVLPIVGLAFGVLMLATFEPTHLHPIVVNHLNYGWVLLWTLAVIVATMLLLLLHLAELVRRASNPDVRATFVRLYFSFVMSIIAFLFMLIFIFTNVEWASLACLFLLSGFLCAHLFCYLIACVELRSELQNAIAFGTTRPS